MKTKLIIALILCFGVFAKAQETSDLPRGEDDLTASDVKILSERIYFDPGEDGEDGGVVELSSVDLSNRPGWRLKLRYQGFQNSCQSYAVAFAADVLERQPFAHSDKFVWDSLNFERLQNTSDPRLDSYLQCTVSRDDCSLCRAGSNLAKALVISRTGIPFDHEYTSSGLCGLSKPAANLLAAKKFDFDVIWWDEKKQPNDLNFPSNNYTRLTALPVVRQQLALGLPVLISIAPELFAGFKGSKEAPFDTASASSAKWHAMTVVGYSNNPQIAGGGAFKIVNSWDTPPGSQQPWGDDGYLWISYRAFSNLVRLITVMKPNLSAPNKIWKPSNIKKNVDGSDQELEEESRIGVYQFELRQRTGSNEAVCLDANDWFASGRDPNQVIMYRCQSNGLNKTNNQKWELWLKETRDERRFFVLRSQSKYFKGKVLAIRDKKLVLEDESEEFDENQRWLIVWGPKKFGIVSKSLGRAIVWAGQGGEFTLQADPYKLLEYSDKTAPAPFILQNFGNQPNQIWTFKNSTVVKED